MQKTSIQTGTVLGPYSPGLEISLGNETTGGPTMLFVSGQIPLDAAGNIISSDFVAQTEQVFQNLKAVLEKAHYHMHHIVKLTIYLTDLANFAMVNEACKMHLKEPFPARATVQVAALPKGALLEIEAVAVK